MDGFPRATTTIKSAVVWGMPRIKINKLHVKKIEITSWKVPAYRIFTRVGEVSEIERVSAANEWDFWYKTNECENPVQSTFHAVNWSHTVIDSSCSPESWQRKKAQPLLNLNYKIISESLHISIPQQSLVFTICARVIWPLRMVQFCSAE